MSANKIRRSLSAFFSILIVFNTLFFSGIDALAEPVTLEDFQAEAEERKSLPIQTNQIENWPAGQIGRASCRERVS